VVKAVQTLAAIVCRWVLFIDAVKFHSLVTRVTKMRQILTTG